jgi:undecaprenyl-diphosphatase
MSTPPDTVSADRRTGPRRGPVQRLRDLLFRLLRWIGRHVEGFYGALGTFLFIGLAIVVIGAILFAMLAREVMAGRTQVLDESVLRWMEASGSPAVDSFMLEVTALGARLVVWMVVMVATAFLLLHRHRWSAALLWISMLGAGLINMTMKEFFDRPRPDVFPWRTPHVGNASFPSGHAMTSIVVYGTLGYLLGRLMPTRGTRVFTYALAALVILLVGGSRLYLGVHYPSDVLGGFATGAAWAFTCGLGMEAVRYFRRRRPEIAAEEAGLGTGPAAPPKPAPTGE